MHLNGILALSICYVNVLVSNCEHFLNETCAAFQEPCAAHVSNATKGVVTFLLPTRQT